MRTHALIAFAALAACRPAIAQPDAVAESTPPDFVDALEAGGYLMGGMTLGAFGGGMAAAASCGFDACDFDDLGVVALGMIGGMVAGFAVGGIAYDDANAYDGSYGMALLGLLGAGAVSAGLQSAMGDEPGEGSLALSLATLGVAVVGTGAGFVYGGQARPALRVDAAMITPMGDGGYGLGLNGRF